MKLNLGCGPDIRKDYINCDYQVKEGITFLDMNKVPWIWDSDSVEEILMRDCLEHLNNPVEALVEARRILINGGKLILRIPHYRGLYAYMPDHRHRFGMLWPFTLTKDSFCRMEHQLKMFDMISFKVNILHGRWTPFDFFASKFPLFWEKFMHPQPDMMTITYMKPYNT